MIFVLEYLIKFSISLSALYVFYRLVLRPLTFYQWNRFYLLGYSLMSFVLPFVNIGPWIVNPVNGDNQLVNSIPSIGNYSLAKTSTSAGLNIYEWLVMVFLFGVVLMIARSAVQYFALRRIRKSSVLLHTGDNVRIYETEAGAGPFSFGRSIYINRALHSDEELKRIIQHEIVHVRQQHTIDLLIAELLCMINWYNPFAWLIRNSIRQNLEFIADNNVLANGYDKKEYQYLLLKVVGIPQYSIASNFNMPDLKKRIAMMNKMKSAKLHLTRFLFALPLLAIVLLAFRTDHTKPAAEKQVREIQVVPITDTVPGKDSVQNVVLIPINIEMEKVQLNEKGYVITIADNNGECIVLVKDMKLRIVKAETLVMWDKNKSVNEHLYGKIPPSPNKSSTIKENSNTGSVTITTKKGEEPLYVVDGIEQASGVSFNTAVDTKIEYVKDGVKETLKANVLATIKPENIESINVLKDKTATDKYGEKGKYGVIEVNTKNRP